MAAICARSASHAPRTSTRPASRAGALGAGELERGPRAAKKPPARGVRPRAVQALPRDGLHDEVVHVHAADIRANAAINKINCHDRYDQIFFDFRNVHLVPLPTLQSVARHGSFSRAARELRLTQPAVSMQVRQLERELGLPLLERVGKRTYTTKAGELLLAHAGRAMQELDRGLELIQELRGIVAGRVRLGTSPLITIY